MKELLLGSGLCGLGVVLRFGRDSPRDEQELREQATKKHQEDHYALRCLVLDI